MRAIASFRGVMRRVGMPIRAAARAASAPACPPPTTITFGRMRTSCISYEIIAIIYCLVNKKNTRVMRHQNKNKYLNMMIYLRLCVNKRGIENVISFNYLQLSIGYQHPRLSVEKVLF